MGRYACTYISMKLFLFIDDEEFAASTRRKTGAARKQNEFGETALHQAAKRGNIERLRQLVNEDAACVRICDHSGWLPIHDAANEGYYDSVEILLGILYFLIYFFCVNITLIL